MNLFAEFRSCIGGATSSAGVEAEAEATATPPQQEPVITGTSNSARRRLTKVLSTTHWKPELSAISEDGVVLAGHTKSQSEVGSSNKKVSVKAKSTARIRSPTYADGYWGSRSAMALPAFSPTPYLF